MQPAPTLGSVLFCFALLFPITFVLQSTLAYFPAGTREMAQFLVSAALFAGIPLVAIAWRRVDAREGLQWYPPPAAAMFGAFLLGPALVPWTYELLVLWREWGFTFLDAAQEDRIRELVQSWRTQSPVLIAGTFAATGAAEELFFRGFLFSALRRRMAPAATILASAFLFGLSHFIFSFDRLLPSTLLGVILGWLCWSSRSVFPGMVLHATYNAVFVLLAYYWTDSAGGSDHVPVPWLAATVAIILLAALVVEARRQRNS
jgi:ABC-2 type transport system permease protein/sodium transport system permease protein